MPTLSQWSHSHPIDRPSCVLPHVQTNRPWAKHKVEDLLPALRRYANTNDAKKYGINDFSQILSMTGYTMDPWGLPSTDNKVIHAHWSDRFEHNLRVVIETLYPPELVRNDIGLHPISVRLDANSGGDQFTTDIVVKKRLIDRVLDNFDLVTNLYHRGDYKRLHQDFGILFLALVRRRMMMNPGTVEFDKNYRIISASPKPRTAYTYDGRSMIADMTNPLHSMVWDMRVRIVMAIALLVNIIIAPYNDALNNAEFASCPSYSHASDVRKTLKTYASKLSILQPIGSDIDHLDQSISPILIRKIVSVLREVHGLKEDFCRWMLDAFFCPWMSNGIFHDAEEVLPYIKGDPYNPQANYLSRALMLYSGHRLTTNIGRMAVTTADVTAKQTLGIIGPTDDDIKKHLRFADGATSTAFNQSDDMLSWVLPEFVDLMLSSYTKHLNDAYSAFSASLEPPSEASYLSNFVMYNSSIGSWDALPDLARGIARTLCPEHSRPDIYMTGDATHNEERILRYMGVHGEASPEFMRSATKFGMFGLYSRNEEWSKIHPAFSSIWSVVLDSLNRFDPTVVPSMEQFARLESYALESMKIEAMSLSDLDVLIDPSKLDWKYNHKEISDAIYKMFYYSVPVEKSSKIRNFILE